MRNKLNCTVHINHKFHLYDSGLTALDSFSGITMRINAARFCAVCLKKIYWYVLE